MSKKDMNIEDAQIAEELSAEAQEAEQKTISIALTDEEKETISEMMFKEFEGQQAPFERAMLIMQHLFSSSYHSGFIQGKEQEMQRIMMAIAPQQMPEQAEMPEAQDASE